MSPIQLFRSFTLSGQSCSQHRNRLKKAPKLQRSVSQPSPRVTPHHFTSFLRRSCSLKRLNRISESVFPWLEPRHRSHRNSTATDDCDHMHQDNNENYSTTLVNIEQQVQQLLDGYDQLTQKVEQLIDHYSQNDKTNPSSELTQMPLTENQTASAHQNLFQDICDQTDFDIPASQPITPPANRKDFEPDCMPAPLRTNIAKEKQQHITQQWDQQLITAYKIMKQIKNPAELTASTLKTDATRHLKKQLKFIQTNLESQLLKAREEMEALSDKVHLTTEGVAPVSESNLLACVNFGYAKTQSEEIMRGLNKIRLYTS